ncbi:MAG TPA: ABC transporter ATP-binding protein, partial [Pirellulales bacterium]
VAENVRLGRRDLTSAEIREALQTVGLLEDVHHLPHGMETPLVPSGRPLSLSQTRRLALARAIVGRPRLLILDGALDGLDLAESPELLDRLFDRAAPWTLLVSSHDPAVTARCERTIDLSEHDDPPGAEVKRSRDLASSATGESHS